MCDQQSLRSACAYAQSDQSLSLTFEYSITFEYILTEHHLEFLSFKGAAQDRLSLHLSNRHIDWKSYVVAHMIYVHSSRTCPIFILSESLSIFILSACEQRMLWRVYVFVRYRLNVRF